ncbi:MAG: SsrA-binding protein [Candidatus Omnitrophica bacterium CG1_02_49_10]|nr:MAG: SsrA-binding protein [Candidatus Omnitrophica bacterium CG1_02_49_10]
MSIVATNRRARHDYTLFNTVEAGIVLKGTEVKSLRMRLVSLTESFARIDDDEVFLYNMHINPYEHGGINNVEPTRTRKLLLHKAQIKRLAGDVSQKGFTLIPLQVYFKRGVAKVEIAVARGKQNYDKRQKLKKDEHDREVRRAMSSRG